MFKKNTAIFMVVFLFFTMFPSISAQKVYAYQNNSYFNDLRVGLTTMSATNMNVVLNGDYSINGQAFPTGTNINLTISGTSIVFNGNLYNQINVTPNNKSSLLTIISGSVSNKYMGSFLLKVLDGKILPINIIDMENYLKGVVGYEMSDYFPMEALKAQAVAARNYALSRIGWENAKGFDFDDTINYQVYKGYNGSYARVISAVEQTAGQVLLHNERLVETLYSAWHGGVSEDSENVWGNIVPYLRSVQDTYENDSWPNGNRVLTNAQIQSILISKKYISATDTFVRLDLNSITRYKSSRVSNINIIYKNSLGIEQVKSVVRDNTRTFLSLPSNMYTVTYDSITGAYTFSGKGNGHGLGMSQIGAKNRATAGQTHEEILKFYFQNSYLQNLISKAELNTVSQSRSSLFTGENISVNATAAGGTGQGHLFKYIIKKGNDLVVTQDYSSMSTINYIPINAGSYSIEVYVKDKFSSSDYDDMRNLTFTVFNPLQVTAINVENTNISLGDTINLSTVVGEGSGGEVSYKYVVTKDGQVDYSGGFVINNNFIYKPVSAGFYEVEVFVVDTISIRQYDASSKVSFNVMNNASITALNIDKNVVFTNDIFTVTAFGSSDNDLYKFIVSVDDVTILTRDYESSNFINYIPNVSGNYKVQVFVKNSMSQVDYSDEKSLQFMVYQNAQLDSVMSDKSQLLQGDSVSFSAVGIKGSGSYLYRYVVSRDNVVVTDQSFCNSNSFNYLATSEGNYSVAVYIKDELSAKEYDDVRALNFQVYNPQLSDAVVTGYFYEGKAINFSISSIGVSPSGFNYRYEIYNKGELLTSSSFDSSNSFAFTPIQAGSYTIKIYGKDSLSTRAYDNMKEFEILINSKPLYLSKLPLKEGMSGSDVTSLQNALLKLGYNVTKESGYFGKQTKNAVISFQKSRKLAADGIVGNMTYTTLNEALIEKAGVKKVTY